MKVLALSGSLRVISYNSVALRAARQLAPASVAIEIYGGIASLPAFNPDLDVEPLPAPVADLKTRIGTADAMLIACPEYAHGIPGAFKNALDWLVSGAEFPGKPVALVNCSPRATDAQAALRNVITTMSGRIIEEACFELPLLGSGYREDQIVADPVLSAIIRAALDKLALLA